MPRSERSPARSSTPRVLALALLCLPLGAADCDDSDVQRRSRRSIVVTEAQPAGPLAAAPTAPAPAPAVPEPGAAAVFGLGAGLVLAGLRHRRKRR